MTIWKCHIHIFIFLCLIIENISYRNTVAFFLYLSLVPCSNPRQDKWSFFFLCFHILLSCTGLNPPERREFIFWLLLSPNSSSLKHKPRSPLPEGLSRCSLPSQHRSQTASTTVAFPSLTPVLGSIWYGLIWYFGVSFFPFFLPHHCRSVLVCSQGLLTAAHRTAHRRLATSTTTTPPFPHLYFEFCLVAFWVPLHWIFYFSFMIICCFVL